jgi:cytochrome c biogenesis protein CcmG, thiol:disulfide interchange protein DsbE
MSATTPSGSPRSLAMRGIAGAVPGVLLIVVLVTAGRGAAGGDPVIGSAPAFAVTTGSRTVSAQDLQGAPALIAFVASWCRPCVADASVLRTLHERFDNVRFISVGFQDDRSSLAAFASLTGMTWTVADDPGGGAAGAFAVVGVPDTFVLDASGRVIGHMVGPLDGATAARDLREAGGVEGPA